MGAKPPLFFTGEAGQIFLCLTRSARRGGGRRPAIVARHGVRLYKNICAYVCWPEAAASQSLA
jgi:hypothetical protein